MFWSFLWRLLSRLLRLWRHRCHPAHEIAYFSYSVSGADGESSSQEDIFAVDPGNGHVRRLTDDRANPEFVSDRDPAWSPDRKTLAIHLSATVDGQSSSQLWLISASDGLSVKALVPGNSPEWLDAMTLLYLGGQGDVWNVDVATLATRQITNLGAAISVHGISWHPLAGLAVGMLDADGRGSIGAIPATAVAAARASGGSPVTTSGVTVLTDPAVNAGLPGWSSTADRIALTTWQAGTAPGESPSRIGHLDLPAGAVTVFPGDSTSGTTLSDSGAVFSPDDRMLAWVRGFEDSWTEIWLHNLVTGTTRRLTDEGQGRYKASLDW